MDDSNRLDFMLNSAPIIQLPAAKPSLLWYKSNKFTLYYTQRINGKVYTAGRLKDGSAWISRFSSSKENYIELGITQNKEQAIQLCRDHYEQN